MKKTTTLLAAAIVSLVAGLGIATSGSAFAQSHATHNLQSKKPPTFEGGARARAFDIQNGMMWNRDGLNYRSPTGLYYNPRTGAVCPGQAAAACF
jgi:hypothetical protein